MHQLLAMLLLALVFGAVASVALPARRSGLLAAAALISPVLALPLANPGFVAVGWHEFMHSSIVLNILNRGGTPEDVLLAGQPLRYPWAHHFLVAAGSRVMGAAPSFVFWLVNLAALALFLFALNRLARLIDSRRQVGGVAVLLGTLGTSPFFFHMPAWAGSMFNANERALPLHKFAHANSNSLGLVAFFFFLLFTAHLFSRREKFLLPTIGIASAVAAAGLLYPICWVAIVIAAAGISSGHALMKPEANVRARVASCFFGLAVGTALALPHMVSIGTGRAASANMSLNLHVANRLVDLTLVSLLPFLLVWIKRDAARRIVGEHRSGVITMVSTLAALALLYVFVSVPLYCEYKYLMLYTSVLGILVSPLLLELRRGHAIAAALFLAIVALPTVSQFSGIYKERNFDEPVHLSGTDLIYEDQRIKRLHAWLVASTPRDAVVVDSFLSAPALSGRSLYVATDIRRAGDPHFKGLDGWYMRASIMSAQVFGQPADVVQRRLSDALVLLSPNRREDVTASASRIAAEMGQRTVAVIVRNEKTLANFEGNPRFRLAYSDTGLWVFVIERF